MFQYTSSCLMSFLFLFIIHTTCKCKWLTESWMLFEMFLCFTEMSVVVTIDLLVASKGFYAI